MRTNWFLLWEICNQNSLTKQLQVSSQRQALHCSTSSQDHFTSVFSPSHTVNSQISLGQGDPHAKTSVLHMHPQAAVPTLPQMLAGSPQLLPIDPFPHSPLYLPAEQLPCKHPYHYCSNQIRQTGRALLVKNINFILTILPADLRKPFPKRKGVGMSLLRQPPTDLGRCLWMTTVVQTKPLDFAEMQLRSISVFSFYQSCCESRAPKQLEEIFS